ncbi:class I SAM-dependent methyltransferase [Kibdelosporangium aridum]|uniref:class I SAM-dependent methyltransferase n=1 Tax=Kibdelosporangium aridum TaxID=2030 RepID=UPI000B2C370C|nr:class I SAM-dependent methyltransferase [Kibdelosporangium aridum]
MQVDEFKSGIAQMCELGDYLPVARFTEPAARQLLGRVGVVAGQRVLEAAAGYGNAAVLAAELDARVTAFDLADRMVEQGTARTTAAGLDVRWTKGDLEDIPLPDRSFDVVVSTFGMECAPRPEVAVRELHRVLDDGGRLGLAQWMPDGHMGRLYEIFGQWKDRLPDFLDPFDWGREEGITEFLSDWFTGIEITEHTLPWRFASLDAAHAYWEQNFPPTIGLFLALGDEADELKKAINDLTVQHARVEPSGAAVLEFQYVTVVADAR